jgi:RsmE family RNA methyltransferase
MNLVLLEPGELADGGTRARVSGRRAAHVALVHRAGTGDTLRVGVIGGRCGTGRVVESAADAVVLDVTLDADPPPPLPATLLLALPRPKVLRRTLAAVASMGVKRIVLLNAARVERAYWESPLLADAAVRAALVLGLEQARDTILPELLQRRRFRPFVEDELPALAAGSLRLTAHPAGAVPCPRAVEDPVTLAVGPEGGFVPFEVELLQQQGFASVSLGPRPLRVEHAIPALLARLF